MQIHILTLFPELMEAPFRHSMMKRAIEKGHLHLYIHNIRNWSTNKHNQVDDTQYGGGAGMVMMPEPIARCLDELQAETPFDEIIFVTPDGELLDQPTANRLSGTQNIAILCGHYKGVDQRIREKYITKEVSIGNYVLTGGELAAAVIADAVVRLIPGVLGDETSALEDSFQDGLLSPPVYTRPADFRGIPVPEVLQSGHTANIATWRHEQALIRTRERRPELYEKFMQGE
ncbi:MAG: tRNA (guanosine(37)-N1)-methyltransferase TrmD [Flavobacteriaceae bacterium]|nr:tRNA (guanosine(37)-N1)-methyltransferase TrmD [Flavobacteriaceae bacterium]